MFVVSSAHRVVIREPGDRQVGKVGQQAFVVGLSRGEEEQHRLRQQPPADESEHMVRRLIDPLRVVDQANQGLFGRSFRE